MKTRLWTFVLLAAVTVSARAQLRLPALPTLPPLQSLPQSVTQTLDQTNSASLDRLRDLRHIAAARLIDANRRLIEPDPHGEPIVRNEVLALAPSDAAIDQARSLGFIVAREQNLSVPDLHVVIFTAPNRMSTRKALRALQDADPDGTYDYNHIYLSAADMEPNPLPAGAGAAAAPGTATAAPTPPAPIPDAATAPSRIRVGLLDGGVDATHPVFATSDVHSWGCGNRPVPSVHGTAVASLLVTRSSADLYAADVYCGLPTGGAVDTIIAALAWMTSQHVAVINVSLVGPKNTLLERTVSVLVAQGYLLIAAVGNDGPTAPPLYPAAYANVVGVTGVDASRRVLLEAERGPQVMFAAPGADLKAATTEHGVADVRGTSFASPTVAALLASTFITPGKAAADAAIAALAALAIDLGAPGKDLTYGFGLVGDQPQKK